VEFVRSNRLFTLRVWLLPDGNSYAHACIKLWKGSISNCHCVIPYGKWHSVAVPWNTSINGYTVPLSFYPLVVTMVFHGKLFFSQFCGPVFQILQLTVTNFPHIAVNFLWPSWNRSNVRYCSSVTAADRYSLSTKCRLLPGKLNSHWNGAY